MNHVTTVDPESVPAETDEVPAIGQAPASEAAHDPTPAPSGSPDEPAAADADADADADAIVDAQPAGEDAPAEIADDSNIAEASAAWGRVDEHGAVYVRDTDGERQVGEYPDGSPEEALGYFERKFAEFAGQVTLLEQRAHRGAPPADVARAVAKLREALREPSAVGNIQSLRDRVGALSGEVGDLSAKRSEEQRAAVDVARVERTAIVTDIEALAQRDPGQVQWKSTGQTVDALFERWQTAQKSSTRLPKGEANDLWRRFRDARAVIDGQRRAFFAELDSQQGAARAVKERLVQRAEALAGSQNDPIGAYRALLDEWKAAGRAGRKVDDALWARFRAAGDQVYQAKAETQRVQDSEYGANLDEKMALLDEAEPLLAETDAKRARAALTGIQRRWEASGRVPREQVRVVEDRMRRVEQAVKSLEQEQWRRSNPETKARSEGLAAQLGDAIAKLERELADAEAAGDRRRIKDAQDALAARRIWLDALR